MRAKTPPQHGERRCYIAGCRQPECVAANKRYCKQYQLATIHQPIRIDAAPVVAYLDHLANQGYSHRQIAGSIGRRDGEVSKLRLRQQPNITTAVARAYLGVRLTGVVPAFAVTDATGTIRRGQALHAIGYPLYRIAKGIPMAQNGFAHILSSRPPTVRVSVADGMTRLYTELRWKPGASVHARNNAARLGWHGPMAWDGNIDDPTAEPEVLPEYKPIPRNGRDSMRREEIEHLRSCGESVASIAKQMNASEEYIHDLLVQNRTRRDRAETRQAVAA
jgi:hypothetical protein